MRLGFLDRGERQEGATQIQKKGRNVSKEREDYVKSSSNYSDNDDHTFFLADEQTQIHKEGRNVSKAVVISHIAGAADHEGDRGGRGGERGG